MNSTDSDLLNLDPTDLADMLSALPEEIREALVKKIESLREDREAKRAAAAQLKPVDLALMSEVEFGAFEDLLPPRQFAEFQKARIDSVETRKEALALESGHFAGLAPDQIRKYLDHLTPEEQATFNQKLAESGQLDSEKAPRGHQNVDTPASAAMSHPQAQSTPSIGKPPPLMFTGEEGGILPGLGSLGNKDEYDRNRQLIQTASDADLSNTPIQVIESFYEFLSPNEVWQLQERLSRLQSRPEADFSEDEGKTPLHRTLGTSQDSNSLRSLGSSLSANLSLKPEHETTFDTPWEAREHVLNLSGEDLWNSADQVQDYYIYLTLAEQRQLEKKLSNVKAEKRTDILHASNDELRKIPPHQLQQYLKCLSTHEQASVKSRLGYLDQLSIVSDSDVDIEYSKNPAVFKKYLAMTEVSLSSASQDNLSDTNAAGEKILGQSLADELSAYNHELDEKIEEEENSGGDGSSTPVPSDGWDTPGDSSSTGHREVEVPEVKSTPLSQQNMDELNELLELGGKEDRLEEAKTAPSMTYLTPVTPDSDVILSPDGHVKGEEPIPVPPPVQAHRLGSKDQELSASPDQPAMDADAFARDVLGLTDDTPAPVPSIMAHVDPSSGVPKTEDGFRVVDQMEMRHNVQDTGFPVIQDATGPEFEVLSQEPAPIDVKKGPEWEKSDSFDYYERQGQVEDLASGIEPPQPVDMHHSDETSDFLVPRADPNRDLLEPMAKVAGADELFSVNDAGQTQQNAMGVILDDSNELDLDSLKDFDSQDARSFNTDAEPGRAEDFSAFLDAHTAPAPAEMHLYDPVENVALGAQAAAEAQEFFGGPNSNAQDRFESEEHFESSNIARDEPAERSKAEMDEDFDTFLAYHADENQQPAEMARYDPVEAVGLGAQAALETTELASRANQDYFALDETHYVPTAAEMSHREQTETCGQDYVHEFIPVEQAEPGSQHYTEFIDRFEVPEPQELHRNDPVQDLEPRWDAFGTSDAGNLPEFDRLDSDPADKEAQDYPTLPSPSVEYVQGQISTPNEFETFIDSHPIPDQPELLGFYDPTSEKPADSESGLPRSHEMDDFLDQVEPPAFAIESHYVEPSTTYHSASRDESQNVTGESETDQDFDFEQDNLSKGLVSQSEPSFFDNTSFSVSGAPPTDFDQFSAAYPVPEPDNLGHKDDSADYNDLFGGQKTSDKLDVDSPDLFDASRPFDLAAMPQQDDHKNDDWFDQHEVPEIITPSEHYEPTMELSAVYASEAALNAAQSDPSDDAWLASFEPPSVADQTHHYEPCSAVDAHEIAALPGHSTDMFFIQPSVAIAGDPPRDETGRDQDASMTYLTPFTPPMALDLSGTAEESEIPPPIKSPTTGDNVDFFGDQVLENAQAVEGAFSDKVGEYGDSDLIENDRPETLELAPGVQSGQPDRGKKLTLKNYTGAGRGWTSKSTEIVESRKLAKQAVDGIMDLIDPSDSNGKAPPDSSMGYLTPVHPVVDVSDPDAQDDVIPPPVRSPTTGQAPASIFDPQDPDSESIGVREASDIGAAPTAKNQTSKKETKRGWSSKSTELVESRKNLKKAAEDVSATLMGLVDPTSEMVPDSNMAYLTPVSPAVDFDDPDTQSDVIPPPIRSPTTGHQPFFDGDGIEKNEDLTEIAESLSGNALTDAAFDFNASEDLFTGGSPHSLEHVEPSQSIGDPKQARFSEDLFDDSSKAASQGALEPKIPATLDLSNGANLLRGSETDDPFSSPELSGKADRQSGQISGSESEAERSDMFPGFGFRSQLTFPESKQFFQTSSTTTETVIDPDGQKTIRTINRSGTTGSESDGDVFPGFGFTSGIRGDLRTPSLEEPLSSPEGKSQASLISPDGGHQLLETLAEDQDENEETVPPAAPGPKTDSVEDFDPFSSHFVPESTGSDGFSSFSKTVTNNSAGGAGILDQFDNFGSPLDEGLTDVRPISTGSDTMWASGASGGFDPFGSDERDPSGSWTSTTVTKTTIDPDGTKHVTVDVQEGQDGDKGDADTMQDQWADLQARFNAVGLEAPRLLDSSTPLKPSLSPPTSPSRNDPHNPPGTTTGNLLGSTTADSTAGTPFVSALDEGLTDVTFESVPSPPPGQ